MSRWLIALVLAGCSGPSAPPPAHPERAHAHTDAGAVAVADPAPPSDAECDALIDHAVTLAATEPGHGSASSDDLGRVRGELRASYAARCHAMSRAGYACAVAASTLAALADCGK